MADVHGASGETLVDGAPSQVTHSATSYVTLYWHYTMAGTPVDVDEGSISVIFTLGGVPVSPQIMLEAGKEDPGSAEVGKYSISFLTDGLEPGTYDIVITGTYQGETITITSQLRVAVMPVIQSMINLVRMSLFDHDSGQYLGLFRQRHWGNPELYNALRRALDWINTCPPNVQKWTFDDFGANGKAEQFQVYLFTLAKFYALMDRITLESFNAVTINDEISININYSQSLQSLATAIEKIKQEVVQAKRGYTFAHAGAKALISTRFPFTFTRIMGLLPASQRVYFPGNGMNVDIGYRPSF